MGYPVSNFMLEKFPELTTKIFGLPAWYWSSIFLALIVALVLASFIKIPLSYILAFFFRQNERSDKLLFVENLTGPIRILSTLIIFLLLSIFIKDPEPFDNTMSIAIKLALFLSLAYLCYSLIDLAFSRLIKKNLSPRSRVALVLPLGRRIAKTLLIIVAFLLLLAQFGVDVSAFLVGLGVGGLAIALAAQKILENLFGGAVLSLDQPFQVGDYCKFGDILGYIEEIGIRSTRIRTLDRTLITIPNSKLSELYIENYNEREKIRLNIVLRLDLTTSLPKIKELLSQFESILTSDENFYHDLYRVRLVGMSDLGFDIEIYSYAKSTQWTEFVMVRENLYFAFIEKMNELGVKLALPGRITYLHEPLSSSKDQFSHLHKKF
jgi:MscS family membrane protein